MSNTDGRPSPDEIIEAEKAAYLSELPPPDPDWPPDVRAMYEELFDHLFDIGLKISDVMERCGLGNNNIFCRFGHFTGRTPKEFVLHHRMVLAKRLVKHETLTVTQVAFAVGYASPNGFSMTFKRRVGASPTTFREKKREDT
jgi:AraC-like DNA-binding protein